MVKKWVKKTGIYAGCLMLGISGYTMLRNIAEENAPEFTKTEVVIGKDTISMQDFYDNLQYKDSVWQYTAKDGTVINVDSLLDVRQRNKKVHAHYKSVKLRERVDTVYASYGDERFKEKTSSDIMYKIGARDSLPNMPSMGIHSYGTLTVREFIADNPKLQSFVDIYNDSHNATHRHELQHYLNMTYGMREWNSHSIKFVECCEDEISANIAQCIQQRRNYFAHNRDLEYITPRFGFYKDTLAADAIRANPDVLSEKEIEIIANGVFDAWMKDKYNIYVKGNDSRAKYYVKDATYAAVQDNFEVHDELMAKCFNIDGYNFWPYIKKREPEIFDRISQEQRKNYASLCRDKFRKMTYVQKLEYMKQKEGKKPFDKKLRENWVTAKIIRLFGKDR